ncbi:MAG: hypothetical protein UW92_C0014G0008 [Candidatus Jorgensenbacteria bacterium GW2011_GWA2_45_13]|uniref:Uncharacterized protein n=1 Tax=Candidatus Jorgensenbacteria bacterium GW2011_GWA2_45_13 TaxID=1618662 RepID=A0A0G1L687_9BACT|nr:MAG: hypothetical protein UW92_C0014G0008 [Candidatus Jorgensenbacteria bacterium GW2011_GWA2_45_13]
MLDEHAEALRRPACPVRAYARRLAPDDVFPVLETGSLKEQDVMGWYRVLVLVAYDVADVHADVAPVLKYAVALLEDKLHLLQVLAEVVKRADVLLPVVLHVKIGRAGHDELHGVIGHFCHAARVADYNKVFRIHAHIVLAGVSL